MCVCHVDRRVCNVILAFEAVVLLGDFVQVESTTQRRIDFERNQMIIIRVCKLKNSCPRWRRRHPKWESEHDLKRVHGRYWPWCDCNVLVVVHERCTT